MINEAPLQSYIIAMMTNHPELTVTERFDDMKRSSSAVTVSSLIITLNDTSQEELIRWFINLKQKEIELYNNKESIETYTDIIYYKSQSDVRKSIIEIIKQFPDVFTSIDDIISYAEPTKTFEGQFTRYFNTFPPIVLNKWLSQMIMYDYNRTNKMRITKDPFQFSKEDSIKEIMSLMKLHNETYNLVTFLDEIDIVKGIEYGRIFGNFPQILNTYTELDLKRIITKVANFNRRYLNMKNINGGMLELYKTKADMINVIMAYFDMTKDFLNKCYNFDIIVGMNELHNYTHYQEIEGLIHMAKKFYVYYNAKMFKLKRYTKDFLIKSFDEWITEKDSKGRINPDVIKKHIFTVSTVFPELNILSIADEVLKDELNFTESYTEEEFDIFLCHMISK